MRQSRAPAPAARPTETQSGTWGGDDDIDDDLIKSVVYHFDALRNFDLPYDAPSLGTCFFQVSLKAKQKSYWKHTLITGPRSSRVRFTL